MKDMRAFAPDWGERCSFCHAERLTQRTIVPRDLARRASRLEGEPTDAAYIIIVVILIFGCCAGFRILVQLVLFGGGIPLPIGDGVIGCYGELHGVISSEELSVET